MHTICVGVIGGSGGSGASRFAAALAAATATRAAPSLLVDLDPVGGGIDVALGIEDAGGARWSQLHLAGGRLEPEQLTARLPRWRGGVMVLAVDSVAAPPTALVARQVVAAGVEAGSAVVVDLPRAPGPVRDALAATLPAIVVLARAQVAGLAAARAVVASLPDVPVGAVLYRGAVPAAQACDFLGVPLLGTLPGRGGGCAGRGCAGRGGAGWGGAGRGGRRADRGGQLPRALRRLAVAVAERLGQGDLGTGRGSGAGTAGTAGMVGTSATTGAAGTADTPGGVP